jgi:hypothetical protein
MRQRVANGLLLTCPHTGCGGMGSQPNFTSTAVNSDFDKLQKWITDGAPPGN